MKIKNMMPLVSRKVIWTEIIGTGLIMLVMLADNHQRFSNDLSYELFMAGIHSASHKIADINVMLAGRFRMILYYLVLCVFLGIDNYFFYYRGAVSAYTMKRISNRKEMYVRCFTLPVFMFLIMLILSMLQLAVFVSMYLNYTPAVFLPEYHGIDFWRLFI